MIQVDIRRQFDRLITGFTVTGHADFDVAGKDIVCAGVSAITIGTVNALEALVHVDLHPDVESGYLSVDIPEISNPTQSESCQLLLESMVVMLQGIELSYNTYMTIKEINI